MRASGERLAPLLCFLLLPQAWAADATAKIDFNFQVRPVLADKCFSCHGPDEKARRDNLYSDILHRSEWGDGDIGSVELTLAARFRDSGFKNGTIDEFKIFDRCLTRPEAARLAGVSTNAPTREDLLEYYLAQVDPPLAKSREELHSLRREENELINDVPEIMVMKEMEPPRQTYVLKRGAYDARGEEVQPGTPEKIFPFSKELPANRLGLARWMTDPRNPLAARVAVNRAWRQHFGRGIVVTEEDFGVQGRLPSHPENQNLPGFVVLITPGKVDQPLYSRLWGSGFLPSQYQGVQFRSGKEPVLYLANPPGISAKSRELMLGRLRELQEVQKKELEDPAIEARIAQYEMAFRLQSSVPDVVDTSKEPESVFDLYGPDARKPGTFAANCLLARRLAERGVRFIQLYHIRAGTSTGTFRKASRPSAKRRTRPPRRWCRT